MNNYFIAKTDRFVMYNTTTPIFNDIFPRNHTSDDKKSVLANEFATSENGIILKFPVLMILYSN